MIGSLKQCRWERGRCEDEPVFIENRFEEEPLFQGPRKQDSRSHRNQVFQERGKDQL